MSEMEEDMQDETQVPQTEKNHPLAKSHWTPLLRLREEIDEMLGEFDTRDFLSPWKRLHSLSNHSVADFSGTPAPRVDVIDTENALQLTAELPGLTADDIVLRISDGVLTLKGQKSEEQEEGEQEGEYYVRERRYGSFQRSVRIPDSVDPDKIDARVQDGVLTVRMPKRPEAKQAIRKIAVKQAP